MQASGLTLLRPPTLFVDHVHDDDLSPTPDDDTPTPGAGSPTPVASPRGHHKTLPHSNDHEPTPAREADEHTPLLVVTPPQNGDAPSSSPRKGSSSRSEKLLKTIRGTLTRDAAADVATQGLKALPAVLLGTLLNILDAVSCECCCTRFSYLAATLIARVLLPLHARLLLPSTLLPHCTPATPIPLLTTPLTRRDPRVPHRRAVHLPGHHVGGRVHVLHYCRRVAARVHARRQQLQGREWEHDDRSCGECSASSSSSRGPRF